jgi:hypothetical protein
MFPIYKANLRLGNKYKLTWNVRAIKEDTPSVILKHVICYLINSKYLAGIDPLLFESIKNAIHDINTLKHAFKFIVQILRDISRKIHLKDLKKLLSLTVEKDMT